MLEISRNTKYRRHANEDILEAKQKNNRPVEVITSKTKNVKFDDFISFINLYTAKSKTKMKCSSKYIRYRLL